MSLTHPSCDSGPSVTPPCVSAVATRPVPSRSTAQTKRLFCLTVKPAGGPRGSHAIRASCTGGGPNQRESAAAHTKPRHESSVRDRHICRVHVHHIGSIIIPRQHTDTPTKKPKETFIFWRQARDQADRTHPVGQAAVRNGHTHAAVQRNFRSDPDVISGTGSAAVKWTTAGENFTSTRDTQPVGHRNLLHRRAALSGPTGRVHVTVGLHVKSTRRQIDGNVTSKEVITSSLHRVQPTSRRIHVTHERKNYT